MADSTTPAITFDPKTLQNEAEASRREWLLTNGIGGYASGTLANINTRRYHGLLVAALAPPLGRAVLLAKLEETLALPNDGPQYALSANLYPGATYPQGFQWLQTWTDTPAPRWTWTLPDGLTLEKAVWMARGQNTVYVRYRLLTAPPGAMVRLSLTPLLAWRDYHSEMQACAPVPFLWTDNRPHEVARQELPDTLLVKLPPITNVCHTFTDLRLRALRMDGTAFAEAVFNENPQWYYHFQHPREQERGLDSEEDLFAPGTLSVSLNEGAAVVLVATTEETQAVVPPDEALRRQTPRVLRTPTPDDAFTRRLKRAAEAFLIEVPGGRSTIIAGYPWFSDWGRDTMIALPGLCLPTQQYTVARDILLTYARYVDQGMLPNRFPDAGETPEYNTVDATLWYFVALYRYVEASGDTATLAQLWDVLTQIVVWHRQGTRYNIHVAPNDGLLYAGQEGVQLTWMDAKAGDWVVTPRIGKPVEINALWVNALYTLADFARRLDKTAEAAQFQTQADLSRIQFVARFARPDGQGLYDVLDTPPLREPDAAIRPNQIFALSLPFPALQPDSDIARRVVQIVRDELLTPFGLRTLSPRDPAYQPRYEGDMRHRDGAYHQGTVWPWLLPSLAEAVVRVSGNKADARALLMPLQTQLEVMGIGSLCEVYDGSEPQRPDGCFAQAWSVAETLRVWQGLTEGQ